jgi:tetratricopeptide (TPR) repeat protein
VLRTAQRQHPDDFWINSDLGEALLRLNPVPLDEVTNAYSISVALRPDNEGALVNLGTSFYERKRYDDAELCFERACELAPKYLVAWKNLGNSLKSQEKYKPAIEAYQAALKLSPDDYEANYLIGRVYNTLREFDLALEHLCKAVAIRPSDDRAQIELGNLYWQRGDRQKSVEHLLEFEKIAPNNYWMLTQLGSCLSTMEQHDQAIVRIDKAIDLHPEMSMPHELKGIALLRDGKRQEALEAFGRAYRTKDRAPSTFANYAALLKGEGNQAEAIRVLQQGQQLFPTSQKIKLLLQYIQTGELR